MKINLALLKDRVANQIVGGIGAAIIAIVLTEGYSNATTISAKILAVLIAIFIYVVALLLYNYLIGAPAVTITRAGADYEDQLSNLAARDWDIIFWSTKTSIWADAEDAFGQRKRSKIHGVTEGRIRSLKYILHLAFWRKRILDDIDQGNFDSVDVYRAKLSILLNSVRNYEMCPPDKVRFVVGEVEPNASIDILGVYLSQRSQILAAPLVKISRDLQAYVFIATDRSTVIQSYQRLESNWQAYLKRQVSSYSAPRDGLSQTMYERKAFESRLESELAWLDSTDRRRLLEPSDELISPAIIDQFNRGRAIVISSPQKVTISGDYSDMHSRGHTFSAAISLRPSLTIQKANDTSIHVNGKEYSAESFPVEKWELLNGLSSAVKGTEDRYKIKITLTNFLNVGMGSSGAASILIVAALNLIGRQNINRMGLISRAHNFENRTCGRTCGPQDHAISCLGGFRLLEFPSLVSRQINLAHWKYFSFWLNHSERYADEIIPQIYQRHTDSHWSRKEACTTNVAEGLELNNEDRVIGGMREELKIQHELGAVKGQLLTLCHKIEKLGAAAKLSGAGQSGLVVVFSPERTPFNSVRATMEEYHFEQLLLSVDDTGIKYAVQDLSFVPFGN